jgi:dihydrofolate reductase
VNHLRQKSGKDLIVYGGATFVTSLIEHGLIDELHLFINPVAIGNGMRIFRDRRPAGCLQPQGCVRYRGRQGSRLE